MDLISDISTRLKDIRQRIDLAARRARRSPSDVMLLAVSKTFSSEHVRAAAAAGHRDFGENRVQEALQKMSQTADTSIRWHLIGTLQSNKARKAASSFDVIQSIDSVRLLQLVDEAAADAGASPELLVQVDLAGESTKHGVPPHEASAIVKAAENCRAARVAGLMTIPPFFDDPENARPYFAQLRALRDTLLHNGTNPQLLQTLSMGMSHDFEIAVQEGATIVRLGTAIFGQRHV